MPLPKKFPRTGAGSKGKGEKRVLANRYRVEKKLGSGNFGTAWLVTDLKCKDDKEKLKVLKEIAVGDLQPDETVDAMHEASLLRNLDHPGIIKFHDSFIEGGFFCIVTEYAEGGDLDNSIQEHKKKGKQIPEAQAVEWTIQLLLALQYMHDRRVLHRDLKTRNIFLRNNVIKIGDFGISRILMGTNDMASTFVGTPYYMSPEVLKHEGYNSKSDVWSIGCVLYELVSLEHAFEGQSLMGVMYKIVNNSMPEWPKGYSTDLQGVFNTLLETEPAKRVSASEGLKIPFIAKEMESLKNTMMIKHHNKEQKDIINLESQELHSAVKKHHRLGDIKKESEDKKWRNLSPRDRMRLRKQQEADRQSQKIQTAAKQQREENKALYDTVRQQQNPFDSHAPMWKGEKALQEDVRVEERAATAPSIPERADLAETYYSQFEEEFEQANGASDDENEKTLMAASIGDIEDAEVEDLISCMQNALDKSDTIKNQTLVDDTVSGAFGPAVRDTKIRNLRGDAEKKLGKEEFAKAYEYLKSSRFGSKGSTIDENNIMKGLAKIVKNPNDCFIVDQLLFLEAQASIPS